MFLKILQTLFPVFFLILLGLALTKKQFLSEVFFAQLNKLVYWVALPFLVFYSMTETKEIPAVSMSMTMVFFLVAISVVILTFVYSSFMMPRPKRGPFIQGAFRGNLAFVGIPVIIFAFRDLSPEVQNDLLSTTILVFAPAMVLYNLLAVLLLNYSLQGGEGLSIKNKIFKTLKELFTNPLILSAVLGAPFVFFSIQLPDFLKNTLQFTGNMAGPCALICVGGSMASSQLNKNWKPALVAAIFKTSLMPLIAYSILLFFPLGKEHSLIILILSACPTAIASYVLVREMKSDEKLASDIIVLATAISPLPLSIIVGAFK